MKVYGAWVESESGVIEPRISLHVLSGDAEWIKAEFLIDTGAERTVFSYELLFVLQLDPEESDGSYVQGVGGTSSTVQVATSLRLKRDDGSLLPIHGSYYGFTDPIALELSVLGRDVLGHFALIVDRPGRIVALVAGQHSYQIIATT